jgi:hypothetical protein
MALGQAFVRLGGFGERERCGDLDFQVGLFDRAVEALRLADAGDGVVGLNRDAVAWIRRRFDSVGIDDAACGLTTG